MFLWENCPLPTKTELALLMTPKTSVMIALIYFK